MGAIKLRPHQSGPPSAHPSASFWHREPCQPLMGYRSTETLPAETDTVIVGAGITGAFAARQMLARGGKGVVMLEAREVCWGATGRNGGHCQPGVYYQPPDVARFELATFAFLDELVRENSGSLQCDWERLHGVHVMQTMVLLEAVERRVRVMERRHPDLRGLVRVVRGDTEEGRREMERLRVRTGGEDGEGGMGKGAVGVVVTEKAAKCWPYKLVTWVISSLLQDHPLVESGEQKGGLNLQTNTPVTALQRLGDEAGGHTWMVHTSRGQIAARNILLATNAYVSYLLPKFTGLVVPTRGQVAALRTPKGGVQLGSSYGWLDNVGGDDYLIHREGEGRRQPGELIFGGERLRAKGAEVGIWWDDGVDEDVSSGLRRALNQTLRLQDEGEEEEEELKADMEWTGIMGFSKDEAPWVGAVPEALGGGEGLWVCGGYTGHGMPVAARCGMAIAQRICGAEEGERIALPAGFEVTEERVARVRGWQEETIAAVLARLDRDDELGL